MSAAAHLFPASVAKPMNPAAGLESALPTVMDQRCERTVRDPVTNRYMTHKTYTVPRDLWESSEFADEPGWMTRIVGDHIVADRYQFFG